LISMVAVPGARRRDGAGFKGHGYAGWLTGGGKAIAESKPPDIVVVFWNDRWHLSVCNLVRCRGDGEATGRKLERER